MLNCTVNRRERKEREGGRERKGERERGGEREGKRERERERERGGKGTDGQRQRSLLFNAVDNISY